MKLLEAAGLAHRETLDAEGAKKLFLEATCFLEGGGVVTLAEYAELEFVEREALRAANKAIVARTNASIGYAAQGKKQAAAILAPVDGGAALDAASAEDRRVRLLAVAKKAAERLERREAFVERSA